MKKLTRTRLLSKALVIDANIARAAGHSPDTRSHYCRRVLEAVRECGLKCAMDSILFAEWGKHESAYAKTWRVSMVSRKRVLCIAVGQPKVLSAIDDLEMGPVQRREIIKDVHLIETALSSDKRIASLDENARGLFLSVSEKVPLIKQIHWTNPEIERESCIGWIEDNVPDDQNRLISF